MSQPEGLEELKPRKRGRKPKTAGDPATFAAADASHEAENASLEDAITLPLIQPATPVPDELPPATPFLPTEQPDSAGDLQTAAQSAEPPDSGAPGSNFQPEFASPESAESFDFIPAAYPAPNATQALALVPEEVPVFLRNPGPPPKMPRNSELLGAGRNSYRFREIRAGAGDYKWWLLGCVVAGLILLAVLAIGKPQKNIVVSLPSLPLAPVAAPTATIAPSPTANGPIVLLPISPGEQYALVVAQEGIVLEEPKDNAAQMQVYARYTVLSLARKTNRDWYEIKGSIGWIKASALKFYPDIDSAWAAKREIEGTTSNG